MTDDAILNVYDYYNPTDLPLGISNTKKDNVGGMTFSIAESKDNIRLRILIKVKGNISTRLADNANDIKNSFAHESKHYADYKEKGHNVYKSMSKDRQEQRAIFYQMNHSTYIDTTPDYKKGIIKYGEQHGLMVPITNPIKSISK
jgi:hypothetical protein